MNVWAGNGTYTTAERIIICIALIMPHNSCMDPPMISPTKKLPVDIAFKIDFPVSVVEDITAAYYLFCKIGGNY